MRGTFTPRTFVQELLCANTQGLSCLPSRDCECGSLNGEPVCCHGLRDGDVIIMDYGNMESDVTRCVRF